MSGTLQPALLGRVGATLRGDGATRAQGTAHAAAKLWRGWEPRYYADCVTHRTVTEQFSCGANLMPIFRNKTNA